MTSDLLVPSITAQMSPGDRANDVYNRLLKERIVFLGSQVDDATSNLICAQFLLLQSEDAERDIYLYINSPGGSVSAGMAIYDTMQYVSMYTKRIMAERIAHHTGQKVEQIELDFDRDRWFTAQEAKDYGIIDHVIQKSQQVAPA
ncbi:MAG: ATP-dependent Clp protease proteolytic subunit [Actinobacteria bacterium]|nr:ATP-dependent Clp protease proteolytic subunit [Actinomycetota bacterium]